MAFAKTRRAIGTFPTRQAAEHALNELRASGFQMDDVSVIAKDSKGSEGLGGASTHGHGNKADEGAKAGAATGGTVGGIAGLLVGLGLLAIPGIGPVMLAGAAGTAIATALSGGAIGAVAGGLSGALLGLGIPEDQAKVYNDRVSRGDYLVVVEGSDDQVARAESVLSHRGIQDWRVYDIPGAETASSNQLGVAATPTALQDRSVDVSNEESVRLYEERLIADKDRVKTGEVTIGKHVETETARVSVPIEREKVVIERVTPTDSGVAVSPESVQFGAETTRVEVYEETPEIRKEAFVREEVTIRKEVEREIVEASETLRREELSLDTQGNPVVDNAQNKTQHDRI